MCNSNFVWIASSRTINQTPAICQEAKVRNGTRKEDPGEVGDSDLGFMSSSSVHYLT